MKILWLSPFLLHPTTRGGQIRSLGILSQLHRRHQVRFVSMQLPEQASGVARVGEYCSESRLLRHDLPGRGSLRFGAQFALNLFSGLPLTVHRDVSAVVRRAIAEELSRGWHDVAVCDFLSLAVDVARVEEVVLFQHNVETQIWERMARNAPNALQRCYLASQAARMARFERTICRQAKHVIAVSDADERLMRERFGVTRAGTIPTGVDLERNVPSPGHPPGEELVFVGSLDWIPNLDGLRWFASEVLPKIQRRQPNCRLAMVGKNPGAEAARISALAPGITLHGNVADVRPYLWGAQVAIVPLRAGGGTRLKIYEAMAAGVPQVSTTIGAEGLKALPGENILLADDADSFAEACLTLLEDETCRGRIRDAALEMVRAEFGMPRVANVFEEILRTVVSG
jgi:polysaccharide biosynthesis protein PslH